MTNSLKARIIHEFLDRDSHTITRHMLLRKFQFDFDSTEEFDKIMRELHETHMIATIQEGHHTKYVMPPSQVVVFKRRFRIQSED